MNKRIIKIATVDDQEEARIDVTVKLKKTFELPRMKGIDYDLDTYSHGNELLDSDQEYDLILLDYEMPTMNGLEIAMELNKLRPRPRLIFLTSYDMPAKKMFEVFPKGYIYKSDPVEEFQRIMIKQVEKILHQRRLEIIYYENETYEMEYKGKKEKISENVRKTKLINVKDIAYFETGISKKVKTSYIYMTNGNVYLTHKAMSYWLSMLPADEFVHSSKHYVIGLRHVKEIRHAEVIFKHDDMESMTLSRTLKKKFKTAFDYYQLEVEDD
ncbi:MAG: LytTR family DNA-binding domain-containing protein [Defluviitaleaceae bacterium]|nr:LytTR family DNA-binding domain-containing protein [Defluviitaleaceae bacterium]